MAATTDAAGLAPGLAALDYQLHTREQGATVVPGSVKIPAGGLVFFDGDALRHRISPLGECEIRVSLTFDMKDAFAYFGFRGRGE
jgi:hypothetical protein